MRLIGPRGVKVVDGHLSLVGSEDSEDPAGRQMNFHAVHRGFEWKMGARLMVGVITGDASHLSPMIQRECHCSCSQELQLGDSQLER